MWRDSSTSESNRVALYWNQMVTGESSNLGEIVEPDIDPTLIQTIAWLERIDDAQPASAAFSRRFETEFLHVIGAASEQPAPKSTRGAAGRERVQGVEAQREPVGFAAAHVQRRRLFVSIAAGLLLFLALGIAYYARGHFSESRDSTVILAPSSVLDVPMDRGDAARSGVMPGPSVANGLESIWHFEAGRSGISAPAVVGETVFITSGVEIGSGPVDQGSIIAIDALTGSERWRFPAEYVTGSTPAVAGGTVYASDMDG
ncbi:MAG TPA: PQQ-binding-like beta-propeller repeat protein, partial [Thermomicrobiales bacterium]|nr:PQQ-binding-like beta-propeller repeat protein [Thermomicrobiales bacterium]